MIKYIIGDATKPIKYPAIIAHVCNDENKWGRGFVLALNKLSMAPQKAYRGWFGYLPKDVQIYKQSSNKPELGETQIVVLNNNLGVANMIAQKGIYPRNGIIPVRYEALRKCLRYVNQCAKEVGAEIHAPRIGAGLGYSDWASIEKIINDEIKDVDCYVYTLESEKNKWK